MNDATKLRTRLAMLAAGTGLVLAPFAIHAAPAGAASNESDSQASLTFKDLNGNTVTCTVFNRTTHNTDDPNQPYTKVTTDLSGDSASGTDCVESVDMTTTFTYKDNGGVQRTATITGEREVSATIHGTYPVITTTATAYWFACNPNFSARCDITATSHPK